jgi:hypothetical protein
MQKSQIAFVLFLVGGVLEVIAAVVPEASGRLLPLGIACIGFGLAAGAS